MASHPFTTASELVEKDRRFVWHPFTQMQTAPLPLPIVRGKGVYLYTEEGTPYLDGISSWWVNLHGHAHPYIAEKIAEQARQLEHVIFADFTHPLAVELAERLLKILPGKMDKIFYSDNGSTAVEAALKIAIQYWHNRHSETEKVRVICLRNSYHGDTFGAMSAAGKNPFHVPFWKHLFEVDVIDPPLKGREGESLEQLKAKITSGTAACFIYEPLILGVGGMITYPSGGLNPLLKLCHEHEVLTIADEIMTGFGRTGPLFASEKMEETPDIVCLSKGITGGFLPLGAVLCKQFIYDAFLSDHLHHAFLHGHSYTGNPLACASALASLDLLLEEKCTQQRLRIERHHRTFCQRWEGHPKLLRCETFGTLLILEYKTQSASSYFQSIRNILYPFFLKKQILLRPLGNVFFMMPPYCIEEEELHIIYRAIEETLETPII